MQGTIAVLLCLFAAPGLPSAADRLPLGEPSPGRGDFDGTATAAGAISDERSAAGAGARTLRWRNTAAIGGIVLTVGAYGAKNWWNEDMDSRPSTRHEGWFGEGTYAGGADKLGHAYITYAGTRLLARGFEALGNDPPHALRLAAWTSFGVLTGVEVVDAFSKKWRFSYEDVACNAAGTVLAVLQERFPSFDALLDFRLLYQRSDDARALGEFDPIGDYSGQTFLLALKADGVPALHDVPVLRYVELLAGYGTRGYEPVAQPPSPPERLIYYGVGINLSRLLGDTLFRGRLGGGKIQGATDMILELVEVPGTAALASERR